MADSAMMDLSNMRLKPTVNLPDYADDMATTVADITAEREGECTGTSTVVTTCHGATLVDTGSMDEDMSRDTLQALTYLRKHEHDEALSALGNNYICTQGHAPHRSREDTIFDERLGAFTVEADLDVGDDPRGIRLGAYDEHHYEPELDDANRQKLLATLEDYTEPIR